MDVSNHSSSIRYEPHNRDLGIKNPSYTLLVDRTGFRTTVLEIGSSTGYITKLLKEHGNTVNTELGIDQENIPEDLVYFIRSLPHSRGCQFIFRASPHPGNSLPVPEKVDFFRIFSNSFGSDTPLVNINKGRREALTARDAEMREITGRNRELLETVTAKIPSCRKRS